MASRRRVFNETREIYVNFRTAEAAYASCSADWVVYGKTMRDLDPAEAIEARNQQAARGEHLKKLKIKLAYAEVHGLRYDPAASGAAATRMEKRLVFEAHQFVAEQAA